MARQMVNGNPIVRGYTKGTSTRTHARAMHLCLAFKLDALEKSESP